MTNYSVWGSTPPAGAFALYGDGSPSIAVGHRFYIGNDSVLQDGSVVGGKLWCPAFTTMPPQARMQFYTDGYASGTPTAEKVVDITASGAWQEVILDTPIPIAEPGVLMTVVVKYEPVEYSTKYLLASYGAKNDDSYVQSTEIDSLYWAENNTELNYSPQGYRIPSNGSWVKGSDPRMSYGIDIIVADGFETPDDPNSVYAQLKADGHEIEYFVVAL